MLQCAAFIMRIAQHLLNIEKPGRWPSVTSCAHYFLILTNVTSDKPIALLPTTVHWWQCSRTFLLSIKRWTWRALNSFKFYLAREVQLAFSCCSLWCAAVVLPCETVKIRGCCRVLGWMCSLSRCQNMTMTTITHPVSSLYRKV